MGRQNESSLLSADDRLCFVAEADTPEFNPEEAALEPWLILIADDDEEVHQATIFALRGVLIDGRPLRLLHAFSSDEAQALLRSNPLIAVAMLDVVMETPDAGLQLVGFIREELGLQSLRIVLRTGQPGYAPELEVIRRYDINDYRTKSELTQTRLVTTLTAAARAYEQIEAMRAVNRGLDTLARSTNALFCLHGSSEFSHQLLSRIEDMLGFASDALVIMEDGVKSPVGSGLKIVCGRGRYEQFAGCSADGSLDVELLHSIRRCTAARTGMFEASRFCLWLGNAARDAVVVIDHRQPLLAVQRRLIEMFAASLSVGFENVDLIERLDFFAYFDPLTHLPNRTRFLSEVDQDLFSRSERSRCLALADVVKFSDVNNALGYRCGDSLLVAVAKRLRTALGGGVILARVCGDTFGLFGPENALDSTVINKAFEAPFFVHGHALSVQIRLGVVRVDECRGNAVELMRNATLALANARLAGGGAFSYFTVMMSEDVQSRVNILHSLRAAIDFKRGLSLNYQPIVNAASGQIHGLEAFLRWRNDHGELVPPGRFIPLAERTGMINELGWWVMEQALERFGIWMRQGWGDLTLTINLSAVQLRAEDFSARLREVLALNDVTADKLVFDITESIGLEAKELLDRQLTALRQMGVRFALDDFGCGLSSLSQLADYPVHELKIDTRFVAELGDSPSSRALPSAIAELARMRGLSLIAEGVESADQASVLLEMGCTLMQGYYFAHPMPADKMDAWLRQRVPKCADRSAQ